MTVLQFDVFVSSQVVKLANKAWEKQLIKAVAFLN